MKKAFFPLYCIVIGQLLFVACSRNRENFEKGIIPSTPINFADVNSEYDDYNSKDYSDYQWQIFILTFSSNRTSKGANFDFIEFECNSSFDKVTGKYQLKAEARTNSELDSINTSANELGPYVPIDTTVDYSHLYYERPYAKRFFYANDLSGNLDIKMIDNNNKRTVLNEINSSFDDAYPSIYSNAVAKTETMYFCSNRDNSFDIYRATSNVDKEINNSTNIAVEKVEQLSSSSDDKCPFIYKNTMVFVSNRAGGLGGYDLWYSNFDGSTWSEPKNFGNKINTPYDEYRPIIVRWSNVNGPFEYLNNLMIFSSNRPGGKGGFDLYYVGIPKQLQ